MKKRFLQLFTYLLLASVFTTAFGQKHDQLPKHRLQADYGVTKVSDETIKPDRSVDATILIDEDFAGADFPPQGWTVVGDGADNWASYDGNNAGGEAPEAFFGYSPIFEGTSRLTTGTVSTSGLSSLLLTFNYYLNAYVGDYTLKIETTSDGSTWNEVWSIYVPAGNGNIGPEQVYVAINNADVGSDNFQLAFTFDGNTDNVNYWYIDDVLLQESMFKDVKPTGIYGINAINDVGIELNPSATVFSLGTDPVSFDVTMRINDGTSDIYTSTKSVSDLNNLESEDVYFDSWTTPAEGTYTAYVTTLLEGDEDNSNDEISYAFLVMDGVLLYQDFSSGMGSWSTVGDGANNWLVKQSSKAGGSAPEIIMNYAPIFDGTSRLVSPPVNTTDYTDLALQFNHFLDNYVGGFNLKVETSSDGVTWNEVWAVNNATEDIGPELIIMGISNEDVGSETFQIAFTFEGNSDLVDNWHIDDITLREPVEKDVTAFNITGLNQLMAMGTETTPEVTVKNLSGFTATFDVYLTVNNGTDDVFTSTKTVTELAAFGETVVTFDSWTTVEGNMVATATTLLDGDENPLNDQTSYSFSVINGVFRNYVLLEDATGAWCGYCPGAAMGCDDLLHYGHPVAVIANHNGDNYATTDSDARNSYYEIEGFPTVVFGGVIQYSGGSATQSMYSYYVPLVDERLALPTPIKVNLENATFDGSKFTAAVNVEAISFVPEGEIVLQAVLTESHIDEAWQTQFEMNHASRSMFGGAAGTPIDFASQNQHTLNIEFDLDETWVPELCEVVVFVQHVESREIFNADKADVKAIEKYADVTVTVKDNKGELLEGATVGFGGMDIVTGADGTAVITEVEPGVYFYTAGKEGYLPGPSSNVVVRIENKALEVVVIKANLLFSEDFSGDEWPPQDWSVTGDLAPNWYQNNSNKAGGVAPELYFSWNPPFVGIGSFVSPQIDISGVSNASIILKHALDAYQGEEYTIHIFTSSDGSTWEEAWAMEQPANFGPEILQLEISEEYITTGKLYIKFEFNGNSDYTNSWAIDDVWVVEEITEVATYQVEFNVSDMDGSNPIANATINISGYDPVDTDADGKALIAGLPDGTYSYTVTATDYVEVSGNLTVDGNNISVEVEMQTTGINEELAAKVKIYPNPAAHSIWIENLDNANIRIYSITGKLLIEKQGISDKYQMDLSCLQNGNFIINISERGAVITSRISIVK